MGLPHGLHGVRVHEVHEWGALKLPLRTLASQSTGQRRIPKAYAASTNAIKRRSVKSTPAFMHCRRGLLSIIMGKALGESKQIDQKKNKLAFTVYYGVWLIQLSICLIHVMPCHVPYEGS